MFLYYILQHVLSWISVIRGGLKIQSVSFYLLRISVLIVFSCRFPNYSTYPNIHGLAKLDTFNKNSPRVWQQKINMLNMLNIKILKLTLGLTEDKKVVVCYQIRQLMLATHELPILPAYNIMIIIIFQSWNTNIYIRFLFITVLHTLHIHFKLNSLQNYYSQSFNTRHRSNSYWMNISEIVKTTHSL